jgi:hypothetical protein
VGEHKLCKTPANECTLTLLPFELILGRTSLAIRVVWLLQEGGDQGDCFAGWPLLN